MSRKRGPAGPKLAASRRFRDTHPEHRRRETLRMQARYEAFMALARRHPAEYTTLYEAELTHLGLGSVPMERPCPCGGTIRRKAPVGAWPKRCGQCATPVQMERPCRCGRTIYRRAPTGRWPTTCGQCTTTEGTRDAA